MRTERFHALIYKEMLNENKNLNKKDEMALLRINEIIKKDNMVMKKIETIQTRKINSYNLLGARTKSFKIDFNSLYSDIEMILVNNPISDGRGILQNKYIESFVKHNKLNVLNKTNTISFNSKTYHIVDVKDYIEFINPPKSRGEALKEAIEIYENLMKQGRRRSSRYLPKGCLI